MGPAERLESIAAMPPHERGRCFEAWLIGVLDRAGLQPWPAFRPKGEEIDGSFLRWGRTYLLEAKWHGKPIPASTIYQFKGKVDGKLTGTIGVMVSMSGYSNNAVEALRHGKELNVILFGEQDVYAAETDGIEAVLDFKLRAAAQFGDPYVEYPPKAMRHGLSIVVESTRDAEIIRLLAKRLTARRVEARPYWTTATMGAQGLQATALALALANRSQVLIIADAYPELRMFEGRYGDRMPGQEAAFIEAQMSEQGSGRAYDGNLSMSGWIGGRATHLPSPPQAILVNGGIVGWFPVEVRETLSSIPLQKLPGYLRRITLPELRANSGSFARFAQILTEVDF
ncbi:hypothetical protein FRACA_950006 [Frankia canadensis]|uniref:Restriction endonuclease type IV Mrr domain-containing protein n=1 Tax=Frankia canadensis TaxID=1836972 RepID=A0A2I2L2U2_9ACTN|nr:hypothetical protein [Frankia canadensis]SNQ52187.1 hypothetical protein FRACA_950006 [Frankia canadensis]SOU59477.1 hypothetical protein FRACA_950006 [Frankia canadensis]